ncbi:DUF6790 family protein [Chloroflexota bacterium]
MHYIILAAIWVVASIIQIVIMKTPVAETLLVNFLVINIGISGLFAFMGHAFRSNKVAKYIGWTSGNPFQFEIAVANLSFGILGILCIWFRDSFWIATVIGDSIFAFGAAYGHIREIIKNKNTSPGNAGPPLYADILKPLIVIGLLTAYLLT